MHTSEVVDIISKITGSSNLIAFPRLFVDFTGSLNRAVVLGQLLYWTGRTKDVDGWVYKSISDWESEIGLKRYKIEHARESLLEQGLIETKLKTRLSGAPVTHYRISDKFMELLKEYCHLLETNNIPVGNQQKHLLETNIPFAGNQQKHLLETNKSNNTDITPETKHILTADTTHRHNYRNLDDRVVKDIIELWNSLGVPKTIKVTNRLKQALAGVLNLCSLEELRQAIINYGVIINDDKYYYSYKWSLIKFLNTGLEKGTGVFLFLDSANPFDSLIDDRAKVKDPIETIRHKFKPVTENYNLMKIADFEYNTYYGFKIAYIKDELWERIEELDMAMGRKNFIMEYQHFWELELCIAGLLWYRKEQLDMDTLNRYMGIWERYVDEFKEED